MKIGNTSVASAVDAAPKQKPPPRQPANVASAIKSAISSSATQEAQETAAQTRKEAASGDQQAVRKLAHQNATANQSNVARVLNVKA